MHKATTAHYPYNYTQLNALFHKGINAHTFAQVFVVMMLRRTGFRYWWSHNIKGGYLQNTHTKVMRD